MLAFTVRRLAGSALVLLAVSFLVFWYVASTYDPLKPFRQINPRPSPRFFDARAHQLHLDQSVPERYWHWLSNLFEFSGDFPYLGFNFGSDVEGNAISPQLVDRLEITTRLIIGAVLLAAVLAITLGVISGIRRDKPIDVTITVLTFILIALPTFWFAALLKEQAINLNDHVFHRHVFQVTLEESAGIESYGTPGAIAKDQLIHLILPTISLGLLGAASWIRYQRAAIIDVREADFMRLARAKGVRNRTVIRRHGLRNALMPLLTIMAIDVGALFGGAIVTERVYAWNGMGDFLATAFAREDAYAVIGWVVVAAVFVVLFNLVADLLYAVLDPRVRLG